MCLNALQAIWSWISEPKFCEWPHYLKDFMAKPIQKKVQKCVRLQDQKKTEKSAKAEVWKIFKNKFFKRKVEKKHGLKWLEML